MWCLTDALQKPHTEKHFANPQQRRWIVLEKLLFCWCNRNARRSDTSWTGEAAWLIIRWHLRFRSEQSLWLCDLTKGRVPSRVIEGCAVLMIHTVFVRKTSMPPPSQRPCATTERMQSHICDYVDYTHSWTWTISFGYISMKKQKDIFLQFRGKLPPVGANWSLGVVSYWLLLCTSSGNATWLFSFSDIF